MLEFRWSKQWAEAWSAFLQALQSFKVIAYQNFNEDLAYVSLAFQIDAFISS